MRLKDKIAIITGAGNGIGRASAELFAAEGATVIAADIDTGRPFSTDSIEAVTLDVTDELRWASVVDDVMRRHSHIDILFNNAGIVGTYDALDTVSLEDWNRVIGINMNGVLYGLRAVLPHMKAAGYGVVVNTSSIWGIVGADGVAPYTASKGAVRYMSKNVAVTYAADGIRCNSLHPGCIDTAIVQAQDAALTDGVVQLTPLRRLGRPEEVAYAALFLASDESSFMTGQELIIDGGLTTV